MTEQEEDVILTSERYQKNSRGTSFLGESLTEYFMKINLPHQTLWVCFYFLGTRKLEMKVS